MDDYTCDECGGFAVSLSREDAMLTVIIICAQCTKMEKALVVKNPHWHTH